jgi:hypothetical protein
VIHHCFLSCDNALPKKAALKRRTPK